MPSLTEINSHQDCYDYAQKWLSSNQQQAVKCDLSNNRVELLDLQYINPNTDQLEQDVSTIFFGEIYHLEPFNIGCYKHDSNYEPTSSNYAYEKQNVNDFEDFLIEVEQHVDNEKQAAQYDSFQKSLNIHDFNQLRQTQNSKEGNEIYTCFRDVKEINLLQANNKVQFGGYWQIVGSGEDISGNYLVGYADDDQQQEKTNIYQNLLAYNEGQIPAINLQFPYPTDQSYLQTWIEHNIEDSQKSSGRTVKPICSNTDSEDSRVLYFLWQWKTTETQENQLNDFNNRELANNLFTCTKTFQQPACPPNACGSNCEYVCMGKTGQEQLIQRQYDEYEDDLEPLKDDDNGDDEDDDEEEEQEEDCCSKKAKEAERKLRLADKKVKVAERKLAQAKKLAAQREKNSNDDEKQEEDDEEQGDLNDDEKQEEGDEEQGDLNDDKNKEEGDEEQGDLNDDKNPEDEGQQGDEDDNDGQEDDEGQKEYQIFNEEQNSGSKRLRFPADRKRELLQILKKIRQHRNNLPTMQNLIGMKKKASSKKHSKSEKKDQTKGMNKKSKKHNKIDKKVKQSDEIEDQNEYYQDDDQQFSLLQIRQSENIPDIKLYLNESSLIKNEDGTIRYQFMGPGKSNFNQEGINLNKLVLRLMHNQLQNAAEFTVTFQYKNQSSLPNQPKNVIAFLPIGKVLIVSSNGLSQFHYEIGGDYLKIGDFVSGWNQITLASKKNETGAYACAILNNSSYICKEFKNLKQEDFYQAIVLDGSNITADYSKVMYSNKFTNGSQLDVTFKNSNLLKASDEQQKERYGEQLLITSKIWESFGKTQKGQESIGQQGEKLSQTLVDKVDSKYFLVQEAE